MRFVSVLVLALVAAFAASCTTQQGTGGMDIAVAKSAADSLWTRYATASDQHDAAALGALFTDDARLTFSNAAPVTGPEAIGKFLASLYVNWDLTGFRVVPNDFKVSGTLAVQQGSYEDDGTTGGKAQREYGRYLMVMERGENGAWRIAHLAGTSDSVRALPGAEQP